jgi:hypothetical protein
VDRVAQWKDCRVSGVKGEGNPTEDIFEAIVKRLL